MTKRIELLRNYMDTAGFDAVIITDSKNMRYFSGFTGGEGYLLISHDERLLVTDFRYTEQAQIQTEDFKIYDSAEFDLKSRTSCMGAVGFENVSISFNSYVNLTKSIKKLAPLGFALMNIRAVKEEDEIQKIKTAEHIGDMAFEHILNFIKSGVSERDIAFEIEYFMRKNGAEGQSFSAIVASGANGSMPHAEPGEKLIKNGEFVVLDFGCVYDGYCSDMTRTVCVGKATDEMKDIYNTVLDAQLSSIDMLKEGAIPSEVHNNAQTVIDIKYPNCFGHALGHGVGLDIHEQPNLSPKNSNPLVSGNIVTVEPGIYVKGFCGVRIEDLVLITGENTLNLTTSTKKLIEI